MPGRGQKESRVVPSFCKILAKETKMQNKQNTRSALLKTPWQTIASKSFKIRKPAREPVGPLVNKGTKVKLQEDVELSKKLKEYFT